MQKITKVQNCSQILTEFLGADFTPKLGIVLGTGLGGLANELTKARFFPFSALPGMPQSTVQSHAGQFVAGYLESTPVLLQQGRFHLYEGYSPADVVMGIRVMACSGISTLVMSNAAGALNPLYEVGSIMLIADHINRTGLSPLTGQNNEAWGPRFPDMSQIYDATLRQHALQAASALGIRLEQGVYIGLQGPEMESPAETRSYRMLGADAVGMSTVLEVIAARHMGVKVLGLSCLSNKNLPDCMQEVPIEEVISVAGKAGADLVQLLQYMARRTAF